MSGTDSVHAASGSSVRRYRSGAADAGREARYQPTRILCDVRYCPICSTLPSCAPAMRCQVLTQRYQATLDDILYQDTWMVHQVCHGPRRICLATLLLTNKDILVPGRLCHRKARARGRRRQSSVPGFLSSYARATPSPVLTLRMALPGSAYVLRPGYDLRAAGL
eukprot:2716100-Rhodomonas_salina.2